MELHQFIVISIMYIVPTESGKLHVTSGIQITPGIANISNTPTNTEFDTALSTQLKQMQNKNIK